MAKIIIIGAGLSGLSCAYHLEQSGFYDYEIFEKESRVGGLCRSVEEQGFTFDYTGHVLHLKDPYVASLIQKISAKDQYISLNRRSYIYSYGNYTDYPFQTNLYGLPSSVISDCIHRFVHRKKGLRSPRNFHEWVLKHFGSGIGKHFLFPYNKKLWCTAARDMLHTWTGRFVPQTSLRQILDGALSSSPKTIGYNAQFLYPKSGGIKYLPEQLSQSLTNSIQTNYSVHSIDIQTKTIAFENGETRNYDILVNTMPLNSLLGIIRERSNSSLSRAQQKMTCTALVNFNLGLTKKDISDKHWIYFPEKKFSFYRIGFWHNFTPASTPENCSALYGEFSYLPGTKTTKQLQAMTKKAIVQTQELFNFGTRDICLTKILHLNHAYVVYDQWREKNLPIILNDLERESLYSIGRFGAWKYSSMQDAILDGKQVAHAILTHHQKIYYPAQMMNAKSDTIETNSIGHPDIEIHKEPQI